MEDTRAGRRRNRRGDATRQALVEAAVGQLADDGMRGLTHRLVEERCGAAQGSVKHHFGTIDGLVEAVLDHMVDIDLPRVLRPDEDDDATALAVQAQSVMDAVWSRPELARARLALYVHAAGRPALQERIARARQRFVDGIAEGLPGPDAGLGAAFVVALMDGLVLDELSAPSDVVREHAGRLVVYAGVAARLLAEGTQPPGPR